MRIRHCYYAIVNYQTQQQLLTIVTDTLHSLSLALSLSHKYTHTHYVHIDFHGSALTDSVTDNAAVTIAASLYRAYVCNYVCVSWDGNDVGDATQSIRTHCDGVNVGLD